MNAIMNAVAVTPDSDETALVARAVAGSRSAFGELYNKYAHTIHGIMLARVPFRDANDLVQDVFLCAMERLRELRNEAAFGAWLAAIARSRAIDYHRGKRRWAPLTNAVEPACKPVPAQALAVLDIIKTLPEAYRETLILRFVEGMTGPEIAARTGLTPDSVRVNLFRGLKLLREKLGDELAI